MKDKLNDPASCRTCLFSVTDEHETKASMGRWRGRCVRKPPALFAQPMMDQGGTITWANISMFPMVHELLWCGDHDRDTEKVYEPPTEAPRSPIILPPRRGIN